MRLMGLIALLALPLLACTPDDKPATSASAAAPIMPPGSAAPLDFASLAGKSLFITARSRAADGDVQADGALMAFVSNTVVWYVQDASADCIIKGQESPFAVGILYTPDRPRTDMRIPCEARTSTDSSGGEKQQSAADAIYSSRMAVTGDVIELDGSLRMHSEEGTRGGLADGSRVTRDKGWQQHLKVRIAGAQCQVLEFGDTKTERNRQTGPGGRAEGGSDLKWTTVPGASCAIRNFSKPTN
jgi:hypothetical protein